MNTQTTFLTRFLPRVTGIFLIFGMSLLFAGTTVTMQAQSVILTQGGTLLLREAPDAQRITIREELRPSAGAMTSESEQAGRVLFIGMLMILTAFLIHTMYVLRLEREAAEHTPWRRMQRWFQKHLEWRMRY